MKTVGIFVLAISLAPCGQARTLERQNRQDTIYDVRGEPGALKHFHAHIGVSWIGGLALDDDPADGGLSYWAYSDRTAAEARALIMPAILGGLEFTPKEYSEAKQYPNERSKLDVIALKCGATIDPFFITPKGTVEVTQPAGADNVIKNCLSDGARFEVKLPITLPRQSMNKS